MKFLSSLLTLCLLLVGCDSTPAYNAQEMAAIQPCTQQGYPVGQCIAAMRNGTAQGNSNWLGTVGGFAAGVAASNWYNRNKQPTYTYNSAYQPQQPTVINHYYGAQGATQPQPADAAKLIPGQQAQPVMTPTKIVAATVPVVQPVVTPVAPAVNLTKPSVTAPVATVPTTQPAAKSLFAPSKVVSATVTAPKTAFAPVKTVSVSKPSVSTSKRK